VTPSLTDSRQALYDSLDVGLDSVDAVYDHEPNRELSGPCYVTIMLERIEPTEQVWAVRIYSQTADSPEEAARTMDVALDAVDAALGARPWGPSVWDVAHNDELNALVARTFVNVERETF